MNNKLQRSTAALYQVEKQHITLRYLHRSKMYRTFLTVKKTPFPTHSVNANERYPH